MENFFRKIGMWKTAYKFYVKNVERRKITWNVPEATPWSLIDYKKWYS